MSLHRRRHKEMGARTSHGMETAPGEGGLDSSHTLRRMQSFLDDFRSALNGLRRAPVFTALVLVTLALGIGGASSIFSLVNALVLRPLPFEEPERLVRMRDEVRRPGQDPWRYNTSPRSFMAMRERGQVFEGVVAQRYRPAVLTAAGEPARVVAIGVSRDWTGVLGVDPILGRAFTEDEEAQGREARVALLGHELWRGRFGGSPSVVGAAIRLDDAVYTVVGVMPRGYNFPYGADLWFPDTFDRDDTAFGPMVVGRLRRGLSLDRAQAELDALSGVLAAEYPVSHESVRLLAVAIRDDLVSNTPRLGLALLLGAGILLLLSCADIATLLLVRGSMRQGELAVRAALGASASRQARLRLLESGLLALAGAAAALPLAASLTSLTVRLGLEPDTSLGAFFTDLSLDWRVVVFALCAACATALLFGVAPAFRAARTDPQAALRSSGRAGAPGGRRLLETLVAVQVAVALVLLAGASLMVLNLVALAESDPGYATVDRVALPVTLSVSRFPDDAARVEAVRRMVERVTVAPGVRMAGAVHHLPLDDGSSSTSYSVAGGEATEGERRLLANRRSVAGDYFATLAIPVISGRSFTADELGGGRDVVIVNRSLAQRHWGGAALGKRIALGPLADGLPWLTVVGVVADAEENDALAETLYVPHSQAPAGRMTLVVAALPGATAVAASALRDAVRVVDADQPLDGLATLEARRAERLVPQTAATRLMAGFAGFGMLLAALGIHGVLGFVVRRQSREIAIRQALGLDRLRAGGRVVGRAAALAAAGAALGLPAALAFNGLLTRVLGGSAADVTADLRLLAEHARLPGLAYTALAAVLIVGAVLAAAGPAARASRTSPGEVLRG